MKGGQGFKGMSDRPIDPASVRHILVQDPALKRYPPAQDQDMQEIFGGEYDWTTRGPYDENEWRKYRVVPRAHPLPPCAFAYFLEGLEAKGRLDFQGRPGITSVVRWNPRSVMFSVKICLVNSYLHKYMWHMYSHWCRHRRIVLKNYIHSRYQYMQTVWGELSFGGNTCSACVHSLSNTGKMPCRLFMRWFRAKGNLLEIFLVFANNSTMLSYQVSVILPPSVQRAFMCKAVNPKKSSPRSKS